MKKLFYSGISAGALCVAATLPAFADITAEEVRDALFIQNSTLGYEVSAGSQKQSGDTLVLSNLKMSVEVPDEDITILMVLDEISLRETGDGAVEILVPESQQIEVAGLTPDGMTMGSVIIFTDMPGFLGRVSGSVGDMSVQVDVDSLSYEIKEVNAAGRQIPVNIVFGTGAIEADYSFRELEDGRYSIESESAVESTSIVANVNKMGGGGLFALAAELGALTSTSSVKILSSEDPLEVLSAGFDIVASLKSASSQIKSTFKDGDEYFSMSASTEGGHFDAEISSDKISYDLEQNNVDMEISSSEIPFPSVALNYDEVGLSFSIPLSKSPTPREFHIRAALRGFGISEDIWSMFDAGKTLPRDPASVAFDVNGKVMVLADLTDPVVLAELEDMKEPPMLPVSFDISEILISAAGALLTGQGSFAMNFDNPVIIDGIPAPTGEINLKLDGAVELVDKLISIGLIPQDIAAGSMMMLGLFARPAGEGQHVSKIEITPEGTIVANGQVIK